MLPPLHYYILHDQCKIYIEAVFQLIITLLEPEVYKLAGVL